MTSAPKQINTTLWILLFGLLLSSMLISCTPGVEVTLKRNSATTSKISGKADFSLGGLGLSESNCSEPGSISLLKILDDASQEVLASTALEQDGSFQFTDLGSLKVQLDSATSYLLSANRCGKILTRIVTRATKQELNFSTTMLSYGVASGEATTTEGLSSTHAKDLESILKKMSDSKSLDEAFSTLSSNPELSTKYQTIFGITLESLIDAAPVLSEVNVPKSINEDTTTTFRVIAAHWSSSYPVQVLWTNEQGSVLAAGGSYTLTINKNSQGTLKLTYSAGRKSNDAIDSTKKKITRSINVTIEDSFPATNPTITLTSPIQTSSRFITMTFPTAECTTISAMTVTETFSISNQSAPITSSSYSIPCVIGASSPQEISYTLKGSANGLYTVSVWGIDSRGSTTKNPTTYSIAYDTSLPNISNVVLAGGNPYVALPLVTADVSGNDNLTGIAAVRFSENSTYADDNWLTYSTSLNYTLSQTSGLKTVYIWVKDGAGNVSASLSRNITLDFGNPPTTTVVTPDGTSTFANGATVPISWTCQSANGLAASPISKIEYTTDEGLTFTTIASDLPNNLTSTTGSYNWTLPSPLGTTPFRLVISCSSLAGIVVTAYSKYINTNGWQVFIGDPTKNRTDVNISVANVSKAISATITGDYKNHIYYAQYSAIMKIDSFTGMVSTYAGSLNASGCTLTTGSPLASGLMADVIILGATTDRKHLFFASCNKIFRLNVDTDAVAEWVDLSGQITAMANVFYLTPNLNLYTFTTMDDTRRLFKVDLNQQNSTPVYLYGNGSCSSNPADLVIGANAAATPTHFASWASCGHANNFLVVSSDEQRIWMQGYGSYLIRLDANGSGGVQHWQR